MVKKLRFESIISTSEMYDPSIRLNRDDANIGNIYDRGQYHTKQRTSMSDMIIKNRTEYERMVAYNPELLDER